MSIVRDKKSYKDLNPLCCRCFGIGLALAPLLSWTIFSVWIWLLQKDRHEEFNSASWSLAEVMLGSLLSPVGAGFVLTSITGILLYAKPNYPRFVAAMAMMTLLIISNSIFCALIVNR